MDLEAMRPWTIARTAQALELHPFEVVRILASSGALPAQLRLEPDDVGRVLELGRLETWWEGSPKFGPEDVEGHAVTRALARQLLARGVIEPVWTRADNLFRGLETRAQRIVRRAVNTWIRVGAMGSRMSARGLEVSVRPAAVDEFSALGERGTGAYARLMEEG